MGVGTGLSVTVAALHTCPVKAPVCLSRELGVMQPGQTVVELSADGVCHTSRCTEVLDPLTGFYQINTTSVLCDVHCEAVGGSAGWRCVGRGGLAWQSLGAPEIRGALRACPKEALRDLWGKRWGRSWSGRGKERNSKSDGLARAGIWGFDRENVHLLSIFYAGCIPYPFGLCVYVATICGALLHAQCLRQ